MNLTCDVCGKSKPDVQERICAFSLEIHDEARVEIVCDDCEQEHCDDI